MLSDPEGVISELEHLLRGRIGEGAEGINLFVELDELRADAAGKEAERNALYHLFRKGMLPETDLESQLNELREEEAAIGARLELVERAVEKAKDSKMSLDGARSLLSHMRGNIETDDSWSTRRRIVETLVAGIEIETLRVEDNKRGRGKAVTLRGSYRFETPSAEELTPQVQRPYSGRTAHKAVSALGLSLIKTHEALNFAVDQFEEVLVAARAILEKEPNLTAKEVIARVFQSTGQTFSQASVSRMKSRLKNAEQ